MPLPFLLMAQQRRATTAQFAGPHRYQSGGHHSLMSAGLAIAITGGVGATLILALVVPTIVKAPSPPLVGTIVRTPPPPPPDQADAREQPRAETQITMPQTDRPLPPVTSDPFIAQPFEGDIMPPTPYTGGTADAGGGTIPDLPPVADPVMTIATRDPRFADRFQPPYPSAEQRAELEGQARVRIRIGTDGRVIAIDDLGSTHPAFFAATQRQALSRWRFRPATRDGVPVESTQVLTVHFRIDRSRG